MDLRDIAITSFQLDHIPLSFALPACSARNARLAIWQAGLGGCKECHAQELRELAAAGFFAVSFDNWQHGARASETAEALCSRVLGDSAACSAASGSYGQLNQNLAKRQSYALIHTCGYSIDRRTTCDPLAD